MTAVEAYQEASHVLGRYNLGGQILERVMNALMADGHAELYTDCGLRVVVKDKQVGVTPVDPRSF